MRFTFSHFFFLALCAAFNCNFLTAKDPVDAFKWLSEQQELAIAADAPPAPAVNSDVDKSDYQAILEAQSARTPQIIAESQKDEKFSLTLFESIYGEKYSAVKSFQKLIASVVDATVYVSGIVKDKNKRDRPFREHPETVKPLFQEKGFSYPSAHSSRAYSVAVVLGALFPDKKQALLYRAAVIAQSRVNAGVHNPSDIHEGQLLGAAVGNALLANPSFQAELAKVQADLQK